MNVKLVTIALGALVSVVTVADPGTYKGSGRGRTVGGPEGTYTATLIAREITPKSVYEIEETWTSDKGETGRSTLTFHLNPNGDGTFRVKRNGVDVGCGYSFEDKHGKWMDYKVQTEAGPAHLNIYFSKAEKRFLRLGDGIMAGKAMFWTDSLDKVK